MAKSQAFSRGTKVFAIPNAHIDPVWIWDWREGMREVIATFRAAADRLDENDDLYFAASSAAYYAWVEELDRELFARIQGHVAAGRWELVGGEWVEPDCNIPSGESVCRQLLYGQRYFWRAFGKVASIAYNVDSFGHAGSLPQLFRKAGLEAYVMMRPQEHEHSIPASLFHWEGVDGTSILTYRIDTAYQTGLPTRGGSPPRVEDEHQLIADRVARLVGLADKEQTPHMFFVGVGDHGGGPTRTAIKQVRELSSGSDGEIVFASPEQYFGAAAASLVTGTPLPRLQGDLHMHAVGCYSAVSWVKQENGVAERALGTAEMMASLSSLTTGADLDVRSQLRDAWLRVLFNQFHDSLGGTCTEETFEDLHQFYGYARTVADEVTTKATQLVAARADTWIEGASDQDRLQSLNPFVAHYPVPVVVFNPLSWAVRAPLLLPHPAAAVTMEHGTSTRAQNVASREGTRYPGRATVVAEVPALGYRVFWLHVAPPPAPPSSDEPSPGAGTTATASGPRLENDHLVVSADSARGVISSIRSKVSGREWLRTEGIRPVVLDDASDTWSHGVVGYQGAEQPCTLEDVRVVETGPVRAKLRLTYRWAGSTVFLDVVVYDALDYVDLVVHVDWHQRHQLLKLVLPLDLESSRLRVGIPYGATERDAGGQEEVMVHWLDAFEDHQGAGMIVSVDGGYGYDATGSRARFTVLRSPRFADHGGDWVTDDVIDQPATDQGWLKVSYRLRPHNGPAAGEDGPRQAAEHIAVFPLVTETWHRGPLGSSHSAVRVTPSNVATSVFKRAEDGNGWVVRLTELAGQPTEANLWVGHLDRTWEGNLHPYQVLTLFLPDSIGEPVHEIPITELGINRSPSG